MLFLGSCPADHLYVSDLKLSVNSMEKTSVITVMGLTVYPKGYEVLTYIPTLNVTLLGNAIKLSCSHAGLECAPSPNDWCLYKERFGDIVTHNRENMTM